MTAPWFAGRMCPFDLETTSADAEDARIVQAYVGLVGGDLAPMDVVDLVVDPGIEIENSDIHGITTEHAREHGLPAADGVDTITETLAVALADGIPLVGHNIRYDLTVIDRECRRYGLPTLTDRAPEPLMPVIDTQILSTLVDRYRAKVPADIDPRTGEPYGAQVLRTTARAFGVDWDDEKAHGARYDALVAARVAYKIGTIAAQPRPERPRRKGRIPEAFDSLRVSLEELHNRQVQWAQAQDASLAEYFTSQARKAREADEQIEWMAKATSCTGHWPMTPWSTEQGALA